MPTDDERRAVARRLRSVAREVDRGGFSETIKHVKLAVFEDLDRYRPNGTLDRLADLIEPSERACYYYDAETNHCRCYDTRLVDRDTPQKVAEEMFGKMRHSTKEEADAYEAMLKSMSVEIHPVDRDALLELAYFMDRVAVKFMDAAPHEFNPCTLAKAWAREIREALGVQDA